MNGSRGAPLSRQQHTENSLSRRDHAYAIVPMTALLEVSRDFGLSHSAVLLWCLIDQSCGKGGSCWKSADTLAGELGVSARTVSRYVKQLHALGMIEVVKRPGRTSVLRSENPVRQATPTKEARENGLGVKVEQTPALSTTPDTGLSGDPGHRLVRGELPKEITTRKSGLDITSISREWLAQCLREINTRAQLSLDPCHELTGHLLAMRDKWIDLDPGIVEPAVIGRAVKDKIARKRENTAHPLRSPEGFVLRSVMPYLSSTDLTKARTALVKVEQHQAEIARALAT